MALALLLPAVASAQFNISTSEPLSLSLSPQYPQPGGVVLISPQSTQLDLANSTMTVSVNGKQTYSGDAGPVSVTLGGAGLTTTIRATISSVGQSASKTVTLDPQSVSLVVEPSASHPPLYPGRALVPQSGTVRLVAVADFRTTPATRIDPETLSYTWSVDGTTLVSASGIGKTSVVLPVPLTYRTQTASVVVQSRGGSLVGGDSTALSPHSGALRLYVNDPLQGILYDHTLAGTYAISGSEATIAAVPYSLSLAQGAPAIHWFLNGSAAQSGGAITLRPQGSGQGRASLSATASSGDSADDATAALLIIFGAASSNLFGL